MNTKQGPRKTRSTFGWQYLSAGPTDNGERWSIVWDTERKSGTDGRNTALEKFEAGARERPRHKHRQGVIVEEIRQPSG